MLGVFSADPRAAIESFGRLAHLGADLACFGHGEPVRTGHPPGWPRWHRHWSDAPATLW